jgi:hypothetical protein
MSRLSESIRYYLTINKIELKTISEEAGITPKVLKRFIDGHEISSGNMMQLMKWLIEK